MVNADKFGAWVMSRLSPSFEADDTKLTESDGNLKDPRSSSRRLVGCPTKKAMVLMLVVIRIVNGYSILRLSKSSDLNLDFDS